MLLVLLGYSRGGRGAYRFAAAEQGRIRTLAVISTREMPDVVPGIAAIPVFICHGLKDQRIPVAEAQHMYEAFRAAGCNCTLSLVEGDHFIIAKVLLDGLIFQWQQNVS